MRARWLGWAGVELQAGDEALVIDPLSDVAATFAPFGDAGREADVPAVVAPVSAGRAVAGLVSHLHRDHADAGALAAALAPNAPVLMPLAGGGEGLEELALVQAATELERTGLELRTCEPWETVDAGAFRCTALPAVDGLGDPQVSWAVEADGCRILHLGDTMFHAFWWRMRMRRGPFDVVFAPVNGAVIDFPHRQPPSPLAAVMDPEQAALACEILGARTVVPMHYDGYRLDRHYRPVRDAGAAFAAAAEARGLSVAALEPGGSLDVGG